MFSVLKRYLSRRGYRVTFVSNLLNLVVEISGQELQDKEAKVDTARKLWVPAVNAEGAFGRWAFLEVTDPWDAQHALRAFLAGRSGLRDA